jgi:hypothetical protein
MMKVKEYIHLYKLEYQELNLLVAGTFTQTPVQLISKNVSMLFIDIE